MRLNKTFGSLWPPENVVVYMKKIIIVKLIYLIHLKSKMQNTFKTHFYLNI